jgi:transcriptional regulator with XRE-family HTH domain
MATAKEPKEEKTIIDLLNTQVGLLSQILTKSSAITKDTEKQVKAKKELTKEQAKEKRHKDYIAEKEKATETFMSNFTKAYRRIPNDVKKQLDGEKAITDSMGKRVGKQNAYTALKGLQGQQEAIEKNTSGIIAENAGVRADMARQFSDELMVQAKATQRAEDSVKGITEFDEKRRQIEEARAQLGTKAADLLLEAVNETETLYKKEKRILEIKKQQQGVLDALPGPMKSMITGAKEFGDAMKAGLGPLALMGGLLILAIKSFTDLDDAAAEFRKQTGLTNSETTKIRDDANQIVQQYAKLGVEAKDVFDTMSGLKNEFSDVANFSKETVAAITVLNKNFGVSADVSAKVQATFEQIGGLSSETAANVQLQVAQMSKLAGVAPAKVFKDIAENAEAASTLFKGDLNALTKNAVQARRMGSSLKEQVDLSEKLLDFESGIEQELKAATFVGGQFNLSRARGLAMEGKTAEAAEETLKQIQRSGDFRKKDYFTQRELAKASGMTVEQITKQLNAQDKLSSLTAEQKKAAEDAISKGLDITNINADQLAQETEKFALQQEQQKQLDQMMNQFKGIAAQIGSVLIPVLEGVGAALKPISLLAEGINWVFGGLGEKISSMIGPLGAVGKFLKGIVGLAIVWAAYATFAAVSAGLAATVFGGIAAPIVAGAAAAAVLLAGFGTLSKIGDLNSPADGKTQVSTKEGGLYELSKNDDVVAGPGVSNKLANSQNNGSGNVQQAPQINLSVLSAPLNAMITEIKALRADLNAGKIAVSVNMDGTKVTKGISNAVDKSTRNNYSLN